MKIKDKRPKIKERRNEREESKTTGGGKSKRT